MLFDYVDMKDAIYLSTRYNITSEYTKLIIQEYIDDIQTTKCYGDSHIFVIEEMEVDVAENKNSEVSNYFWNFMWMINPIKSTYSLNIKIDYETLCHIVNLQQEDGHW